MSRQNRRDVFDPQEVSIVHCIQRAVRRAMLCGVDHYSGQSFEHRRDWVQQRLQFLAAYYGIDVLGYAIMGNHLHVILRNRPDVVETWSDEEVARRIWYLFPKRKEADGTAAEPQKHELSMLMSSNKKLEQYRTRLSDVSWLMRQLAEKIARMANREDECTGRFWEGRFKCQPLLDEAAILACSAYVDLNPVRAGLAESLETSDYTSAQDRFESEKARVRTPSAFDQADAASQQADESRDDWLAPVRLDERGRPGPRASKSGLRASDKGFLPMSVQAYLDFVDWTGRQIAQGKRGRIPASCAPILKRLGMNRATWCELVKDFGRLFRRVAGNPQSLARSAESHGIHHRQSSGGAALLAAG
jgi:REP element-mobilizing transposase RayT